MCNYTAFIRWQARKQLKNSDFTMCRCLDRNSNPSTISACRFVIQFVKMLILFQIITIILSYASLTQPDPYELKININFQEKYQKFDLVKDWNNPGISRYQVRNNTRLACIAGHQCFYDYINETFQTIFLKTKKGNYECWRNPIIISNKKNIWNIENTNVEIIDFADQKQQAELTRWTYTLTFLYFVTSLMFTVLVVLSPSVRYTRCLNYYFTIQIQTILALGVIVTLLFQIFEFSASLEVYLRPSYIKQLIMSICVHGGFFLATIIDICTIRYNTHRFGFPIFSIILIGNLTTGYFVALQQNQSSDCTTVYSALNQCTEPQTAFGLSTAKFVIGFTGYFGMVLIQQFLRCVDIQVKKRMTKKHDFTTKIESTAYAYYY